MAISLVEIGWKIKKKRILSLGQSSIGKLNIKSFTSIRQFMIYIVLICWILSLKPCNGFLLDGSQNSYAQFRKWYTGLNGTLEFEFKTEQPNGLILYTDDGGTFDFFEVKLVEGAIRLRYNLGGGANIITVGRELHDGHWHKVQIIRNDQQTTLKVDGAEQKKVSKGKEFLFGKFASNSDVFVGGMPTWYNSKLTLLALPSVIYEPRFRGSIRNLVYSDQPNSTPRRQEMRTSKDLKCGDVLCDQFDLPKEKVPRGLPSNVTDACERHDPCQHGGICISTDSGPICDCRNYEYEGAFCEKDKAPSEASFRGSEFLFYDLGQTGGEPIVSTQDAITLYFRTRQANGLLFYTGHGTDYLNLALRDGGVSLTMGLSNGKQEMHIKPSRIRFDDHQWHKVSIFRRIQEISSITSFCRLKAVVDDVYSEQSHIAGKFTILSSSKVYVGGAVNPRALHGSRVHNNFVGCLRKVDFQADTLKLNLIDLARTGSKFIQVTGRVEYNCPAGDPQDPVTFTTRDSYLVLPQLESGKTTILSFKFRTSEPHGLIMLATNNKITKSKFFAVELLNGHIYTHMDLGTGAVKVRTSKKRVDDKNWHEFVLKRTGREGKMSIDGGITEFRTPGDAVVFDIESPVYVGGIGSLNADIIPPPAVWTGTLKQGYVGCIRDVVFNNKAIDIAAYARQQDSAAVKPSCHYQAGQCGSTTSPCQNGGACTEGWNRALCDCSSTLYNGPTCGRESATLAFNGSQHMAIKFSGHHILRTQTEELVLRFKTPRASGLLLLVSAESEAPDRLEIALVAGRVRASMRLGGREKNLLAGHGVLNDNNWHTIRYSRRASNMRLQVDGAGPVRGMLSDAIMVRHSTMDTRSIYLGGLFHAEEEIQMTSTMPNFIGQMQGFVFNGQRYIDLVKHLGPEMNSLPSPTFKLTARFVNSPLGNPYQSATFKSKHAYVGLPILKAYSSLTIDFRFKSLEANGLIFYNGGKRNDFLAIEMVNGHIHFTFDMGDGPITLRDKSRVHMNDNRWHYVSIRRPSAKIHSLIVDDSDEVYVSPGNSIHLELEGIFYVGGVYKDMFPRLPSAVVSRNGFEGCLASVDLGDYSPHLIEDAIVPNAMVVSGCEGPTKCSQNACANRGVCVQHWNAYACECDMTSYTGPTCYDESVAYEFGSNKGMIQYVFPADRQPDTGEDSIALGFITTVSDAVLLRIESSTTQDYMELEIVEGNVFMVYNIGTNDIPLGEIGVKVNDNNYHVIRFQRFGGNATLQLDDYNVQTVHPQAGHQSTNFNSMTNIQVGGKLSKNGRIRIERPFVGVIAGLSVNKLRVLDLAAERDPYITSRGDVQLVTGVLDRNDLSQRMQQTPPSGFPGIADDLIFSGAGSGCRGDDEDECTPPFEQGSGDDLITPVYVPPTKQTSVTKPDSKGTTDTKSCDDEDCIHGSGESAETTDSNSSSTKMGKETTRDYSTTTNSFDTTKRITDYTVASYDPTTTDESEEMTSTYGTTTSVGSTNPISSYGTTFGTSTTNADTTTSQRTTTYSHRPIYTTTTEFEQTSPEHTIPPEKPQTLPPSHIENEDDYETQPEEIPPPPLPEVPRYYTEKPPYLPPYYVTEYPPGRPGGDGGRITSKEDERVAMVIGIVAGALIAVILVILLILCLKSRDNHLYKSEHDKGGMHGQGPNAALLGGHGESNNHQRHHQQYRQSNHQLNGANYSYNGSLRNGAEKCQLAPGPVPSKPKKRDSKDIKEWYV